MTLFWAERAWLGRAASRVLVDVEGDRIAAVTEHADPPAEAQRLAGVLLPGLANAHSHAFHRALRGQTEGAAGDFWSWRRRMYDVAGKLEPDSYLRLARAVYAEMALAGVTVVGEFHYLHHAPGGTPYAEPNAMGEALITAAREAGVRLTLLETCYLRGGEGTPLQGAQTRFGDGDADGWLRRVDALREDGNTRVAAAIHSVRAVDDAAMTQVAGWALMHAAPLHMHLLERREELELDPLRRVEEAGVLGAQTTMVHATHAAAGFGRFVESGTGVCVCRTTERFLADGHIDAVPLELNLSFGSDSHAVVDLFEEARALELDERTRSGVRGTYSPATLLDAATVGGYAALGWEGGRLEPGLLADFIAVDADSVRTAAPGAALDTVLMFAATAADVTDVVVGGRRVVRDRQHLQVEDVGRELTESIAAL